MLESYFERLCTCISISHIRPAGKVPPSFNYTSGVVNGGEGAVRPWQHFYWGGTVGSAVDYKLV